MDNKENQNKYEDKPAGLFTQEKSQSAAAQRKSDDVEQSVSQKQTGNEEDRQKYHDQKDVENQNEAQPKINEQTGIDENSVHRLTVDGKHITLIGTAHVSAVSAQQVRELLLRETPDTICIELDAARYEAITKKDAYQNTDMVKIIKDNRAGFFLANLILANYQKKIADQFGIQSGQEMLTGIACAKETGANLVLADRSIQTTFTRIWKGCSLWEKTKLLASVLVSAFDKESITEEDLKELKSEDMLTAALSELGEEFGGVKTALVDERDQYLAEKIRTAPGETIVAVLGAAHVPGIMKELYKEHDLEALESTGKKSNTGKIVGWSITVLFIVLVLMTFSVDTGAGWEQTRNWLILVCAGAGIGALAAGATLPALATAIVCAPLGAMSPVLASGWFSGLAEAHFRKPKVKDFENLQSDLSHFTGFWKNKVTRILLVVVLTNVGCAIGNITGSIGIITTFINTIF